MRGEPPVWPPGVERLVVEETGSTNALALHLAPDRPTWILARHQTAARGSRGRPWSMPEGNFAATLALRQHGTPPGLSRIGFVAGLALHDALMAVTGRSTTFALKWPNDVLMGAGKLAGILLERERAERGGPAGEDGEPYTLAIGFGVNLVAAPPKVGPGAVPAVALGGGVTSDALLDVLAAAFAARQFQAAEGFEAVRRDWLARAAGLGRPVVARTLRETRTGIFETIDGDGHLILRTQTGRERIASADVFFGRGAGSV